MDSSAPWRALDASGETPGEATRGQSRASGLLLMLGAAVLVIGSLALVALVELRPSGQVEVVSGQDASVAPGSLESQATVVVQVAGAVVKPGVYSLPKGYESLQSTIDWFKGSFGRESQAVRGGFNVASVLSALWADPKACQAGDQMSVEMAITPRRLSPHGPARIFSWSLDERTFHMAIAQDGDCLGVNGPRGD